jgi:hypothetical protein
LKLALPNDFNIPAASSKTSVILAVARNVLTDFGIPERLVGRWSLALSTAMPVPKATVNEDDNAKTWQDDIGATGQALAM